MKKLIEKLKEIETIVELSIGSEMTENKAMGIYTLTNELMCNLKKLHIPKVKNRTKQLQKTDTQNVSGRFQISISEIMQIKNRLREINNNEINNIDFLDDKGFPIKIEQKIRDDWKFTGLNITEFISLGFYSKGWDS
ncbi:MAG: hypothetical protein WC026_13105 [Hyphomicrobium sp.]|uniref:hypothetical protein n=1 Tax=Hyphomicrobium sp. TaxID=82 RepID=UPI003561CE60